MTPIHVYPINDTKPHILEGTECSCGPVEEEGGNVIVHKAFDYREIFEQVDDILSNGEEE